jgi:hypothetical protein
MWWDLNLIPATPETEAGGSQVLRPASTKAATKYYLKNKTKTKIGAQFKI